MATDVSPARIVVAGSLTRERALALQRAADALLLLASPTPHPAPQLQAVRVPGRGTADPGARRRHRGGAGGRRGWAARWCRPTTWRRSSRRCAGSSPASCGRRTRPPARPTPIPPPPSAWPRSPKARWRRPAPAALPILDVDGDPPDGEARRPRGRRQAGRRRPGPTNRPRRSKRTCTATSPRSSAPTTSAGSPTRGSRSSASTTPTTFAPGLEERLGEPGEYPFTRGIHPGMYRDRLWTMRQYAGYATAEETNRRYRYLIEHGSTGLSMAFDLPDPARPRLGRAAVPRRGRAAPGSRSTRSRTCGSASTRSRSTRSRPR